jgi:hypothetical protein
VEIVLGTWNQELAGDVDRDGTFRKLPMLREVIGQRVPHILFYQEGKQADRDGYRLRYRIEMLLADLGPFRGYILRNRHNNLHRIIFAQWPLVTPLQLLDGWDDDIAQQAHGNLRAHIGGDPREFWLSSRHLNFLDGDARLAEAKQLHRGVPDHAIALYGGDFNSGLSGPTEPAPDFAAAGRARYDKALYDFRDPSVDLADTRALDYLCGTAAGTAPNGRTHRVGGVGWLDLGDLAADHTPTVNDGIDASGMRIDHLLVRLPASDPRADVLVPGTYQVWIPDVTWVPQPNQPYKAGSHPYPSDHRYLTATVDI